MKKLTTGKRQMILRKLTKIAVLFVFAGITAGCEIFEYSDPFPDSYYSDNFIHDVGFDLFSVYDTALPAPDPETGETVYVTGSWDFAYRYTDWDQFDYMRFDRANPTAVRRIFLCPEGLAADARYTAWKWSILFPAGISIRTTGTWDGSGTAVHVLFPITGTGSMRRMPSPPGIFCSHRQH